MTDEIEQVMQKVYYEKLYDSWVSNFALNLKNIWEEDSGNELIPNNHYIIMNTNWNKDEFSGESSFKLHSGLESDI